MPEFTVSATARCEPASPLVGEGCALLLELDVDRKAALDQINVNGLPDGKDGSIAYGSFENLADAKSATPGHVVKRMRLPIRFLAPISREVSLTVDGMVGIVQGGSSYFRNFGQRLEPLRFEARPLPEERRPAAFAGAVGRRFTMKQTLDRDHVRPNDLVTATYTLDFDDYCPSNIFPNVENLSKEFKAYEPKEVSRTAHRVTWTQILVPRTAQATNTALVSVYYYNPHTQRYEVARAYPLKLTFVSAEAASTENTSVAVTGPVEPAPAAEADAESAKRPIILRFAPFLHRHLLRTGGEEMMRTTTERLCFLTCTPSAVGSSRNGIILPLKTFHPLLPWMKTYMTISCPRDRFPRYSVH